jgi:hypothetical protein
MARYGYVDQPSSVWDDEYYPASRKYIAESTTAVPDTMGRHGSIRGQVNDVYPIAEIEVEKPAEVALPDPQLLSPTTTAGRDFGRDVRNAVGYDVPDKEVQQTIAQQFHTPQMFVSRPGKVRTAFADPTMRHSAGKLLGMAASDFRGQRMMGDSSLSSHSSKLVQRALEAGVLEPNPSNEGGAETNYADFEDQYATSFQMNFDRPHAGEWSQDEVNRSSKDLIGRLGRRGRNLNEQQFAAPEPEYEQPSLF